MLPPGATTYYHKVYGKQEKDGIYVSTYDLQVQPISSLSVQLHTNVAAAAFLFTLNI